ncbi:MAG: aspartate dehydrogenase domain-containing protein, partial [Candidatus Cryptobacteroides sp.]
CGKLGNIVAKAVLDGLLPDYRLTGTYSRTFANALNTAKLASDGCKACEHLDELLALKPDFIVEAASPAFLKELAIPALENGTSIVALSIGAFADNDFYRKAAETALANGTKIYVASGATGGFDVLGTAALMGGATAEFFNEKGPDALKGTPVYDESLQNEQRTVFQGTATEAIAMFPTKVNVTVAASRASVGPDKMKVTMLSTPGFKGDTQRVEITNPQVHAVIDVYSLTSEIAAWSVVRILRNLSAPIVF